MDVLYQLSYIGFLVFYCGHFCYLFEQPVNCVERLLAFDIFAAEPLELHWLILLKQLLYSS
jgi:hypothetical protein